MLAKFINLNLIGNPFNWAIVLLMVFFGCVFLTFVLAGLQAAQKES